MEHRIQNLLFRGMLSCVTSTTNLDSIFDVLLIALVQPFGAFGIVGYEYEDQWNAADGDDSFDQLFTRLAIP